jgi:hypothetical protein
MVPSSASGGRKLNMGKFCVRSRNLDDLPLEVIRRGDLTAPARDAHSVLRSRLPQVGENRRMTLAGWRSS